MLKLFFFFAFFQAKTWWTIQRKENVVPWIVLRIRIQGSKMLRILSTVYKYTSLTLLTSALVFSPSFFCHMRPNLLRGLRSKQLSVWSRGVWSRNNTDIRRNFFSNRVVSTWNFLPTELKKSRTLNIFKTGLEKINI